jgi:hypothetical protein
VGAPNTSSNGAAGLRREGVAVDRSLESGIVVEFAEDGTGMVIIPRRGADPMRATVFSVATWPPYARSDSR